MARGRPARWLISTALALGVMVAGEATLQRLGPAPASRLPYQRLVTPPLARMGAAWTTTDPRMPYQELRDDTAMRVTLVGGSAAAGLGFSPNASVAGALQRQLQAAGTDAQVLNLGLTGASSREVLDLVQTVVPLAKPDVVIVYSGHNEYLELVSTRYAAARADPLGRLALWVGGLRIVRLGAELIGPSPPPTALPRVSGAEMAALVQLTPADHGRILDNYEARLRAIAQTDAQVLLVAPASNPGWPGARHRRATPELGNTVDRVTQGTPAAACPLPELPSAAFYDHIHFTPGGAATVGAALAACLGVEPSAPWRPPAEDAWSVSAWLGLGPGDDHVRDPDLWKYDRLLEGLDARIKRDPYDVDALVQRGNAYFFQQGGGDQARALWTRAAALDDSPVITQNIRALDSQARSGAVPLGEGLDLDPQHGP